MIPKTLQDIKDYFKKYPGVGPRQAERYAIFTLKQSKSERVLFIDLLHRMDIIKLCKNCFLPTEYEDQECSICRDDKRDKKSICVVEKESNVANIEKTKMYNGVYMILGGNISPITKSETIKKRISLLLKKLQDLPKTQKKELILALNNNREGNFTGLYIQEVFKKYPINNIKITKLGKGLASGNELEYIDAETLKNAFSNRK